MDETIPPADERLLSRSELDKALIELDKSAEMLEVEHRLYTSKLPEFLYHITTKDNSELITSSGIKPSKLMDPGYGTAVSLTDDIEFGKGVVMVTQNLTEPDRLAVFQIPTRYLDREMARSYLNTPNPLNPNENLHEVFYEDPEGISPGILISFE